MRSKYQRRVLAIASAGGHWVQLRRITDSLQNVELVFVTTIDGYREADQRRWYFVADANRDRKLLMLWAALQLIWILLRERPHVVLTTGAAPGYLALRIGKIFGAKTIWTDSIANGDELSLSGRKAGRHADLWLTQWEHLASPDGPHFYGSVM
jgi:UDP-N-acetylglucosamine:LPS N-acetylglucosamine transferase